MADPPGTIRHVLDPHAEMHRLGRERQVAAGQVCTEEDRHLPCNDCESDAPHCVWRHTLRRLRLHDPDHCDRVHSGGKDAA